MKKDISFEEVKDVAVAIVNDDEQGGWYAYIINKKHEVIENVFVTSTGYSSNEAQTGQKTSTFRQFLGDVAPRTAMKIESIMPELFSFTNEYWVSFYIGEKIFDKQYIFVPGSISNELMIEVPILGLNGVMIV
jgi:hypothetical protein